MMSNTPRVFVGTTTFLIAGTTSGTDLQTVTAAINGFPGVRVVVADQVAGLDGYARAGVDLAAKDAGEAVEVPVDGDVAAGMLDPHAVAAVGAGMGHAVGGGQDVGADR